MTQSEKQQSSPASTGPLGSNFETRVQAAFAVLMLTGRVAPCLPPWLITKIKLQGHYAGFNVDDFIVFTEDFQTGKKAKLLAQIKHAISITKSDEVFGEVIQAAWNDFNNPEIFTQKRDAIALITGPLNSTDTNHVRPILEWARTSENEEEFLFKVNKERVSSETKKAKLGAFQIHLRNANGGNEISNKQLWEFLKHFHLLGYDLDSETSSTLSLLQALIAQYSDGDPSTLWNEIVVMVQSFDQNIGTLTLENIPEAIRNSFDTRKNPNFALDLKKLKDHGKYILDGVRSKIGEVHIERTELFDNLIESSEEKEFVVVIGERGCGKSGLIREYAKYLDEKTPIFCLRTEDLDKPHLDQVFSAIGLTSSLGDLEAGMALMPKKFLFIESLEKLLELQSGVAFRDLIYFTHQHPGWTIIASCREYAIQQISFTFLQPSSVDYKPLPITGFSDDEISYLCENLKILKPFADNPSLKPLLKNPFFAELAYRVINNGKEFSKNDGEREFRSAVWRYVISKDSERANGMPLRRRKVFIDIAVKRAKQMVYEISSTEFDADAVLKLEDDNLIIRNPTNSRVRPDHDVFEDWAIVEYIDEKFHSSTGETKAFLDTIGHEPAMNRAFRLWLNQELKDGNDLKPLILSILNDKEIDRVWQDETITAILLSADPSGFICELKDQLFDNEENLLKRFCFILRIACKIPDQELTSQLTNIEKNECLANTIFLKPYGNGWDAIIHFLFIERQRISKSLLPHISAVLEEWVSQIRLDRDLPSISREAGLLALFLLNDIKDSYKDDRDRKKLLGTITRVVPVIQEEFIALLDADLFDGNKKERRLRYINDLVGIALTKMETAFLCKNVPDIVIKIALHEWLAPELKEDQIVHGYYDIDSDECFGFKKYGVDKKFFPPSGAKGPFQYLLRYHPIKGLNLIIHLLNLTAEKYAHSDLDAPERYSSFPENMIPSGVRQVEICLNDGTKIKQYCSERLWFGYRHHSVVPYILQSSLMALENWLIELANGATDVKTLESVFDYILKKSNSVMSTAVLASIATGFPDKLGNAVLPILRIPEFYDLDLRRTVHERGGNETNWFVPTTDPLADIYIKERRKAALQPWRKKDIEWLVGYLQFTDLKEKILKILDDLRSETENDENWKFRLHRIDTRGWQPEIDEENRRIVFKPKNMEPDLVEIQDKTLANHTLNNRFYNISLWSEKLLKNEPLDREYYVTWQDAFEEIKNLSTIIEKISTGDSSEPMVSGVLMFSGSIVKAAAVLLRDHHSEINRKDFSFIFNLIANAVITHADSRNPAVVSDVTDSSGAAAAASVLSICLDFASSFDEKNSIKTLIAIALTHENENVRIESAKGIKNYLWLRDPDFAQKCIIGTIEYSRLEAIERKNFKPTTYTKEWIADFRERFARGQITSEMNKIDFHIHSPKHLLTPCLMIPFGSIEPNQTSLLLRVLTLFADTECNYDSDTNKEKGNEIKMEYDLPIKFANLVADHLFELSDDEIKRCFIEQLQLGCDTSPNLVKWILLYTQIITDKKDKKDRYWLLWSQISDNVQKIAIKLAQGKIQSNHHETEQEKKQRELIREMLFTDMRAQSVDHERENLILGKDFINNFVTNAGINPDVFEGMTLLMLYYPDLFFESGIKILSKHQKAICGTQLLTPTSVFYLERSINRFLYENATPMSKEQYQSCLVLLDALVDTGSSGGYYLREHLIRSRRVNN